MRNDECIMVRVPDNPDDAVVTELRQAGLRVTMPRQAVLTWLASHPHSTADAIAAGVREKFGSLSLQAIYGVVAACTEAGLLRRIEPAGHPARYERRVGDNHHHLVCRRCGRTEDVDCVAGERPCLEPADGHGFTIDEAEVVFWGLCPACATAGGSRAGRHDNEEEWQ
jgi:Fur family transcriptional regulator, stress-responsive regulator